MFSDIAKLYFKLDPGVDLFFYNQNDSIGAVHEIEDNNLLSHLADSLRHYQKFYPSNSGDEDYDHEGFYEFYAHIFFVDGIGVCGLGFMPCNTQSPDNMEMYTILTTKEESISLFQIIDEQLIAKYGKDFKALFDEHFNG